MTEQLKAAAPAPTNEEIRVHFEASIRDSRGADSTPLGTIDLNGKFHHYADSDTDTMWLGYRAGYLRALRAALAADAVPTEREGWRWVPVEPTPEMLAAFSEASCKWVQELGDDRDVYRAMLAAAPQPASEPQQPAKLPDFAAAVAQRKWDELKADGWRMTRIEFERPESTGVGSINPWGVVTWKHQEREPQPAPVGVDASDAPWCECHACIETRELKCPFGLPLSITKMILCPECGNKRCPKANNHKNACTGSNDPGQPGSAYPVVRAEGGEA